jgi:hypothetical protein
MAAKNSEAGYRKTRLMLSETAGRDGEARQPADAEFHLPLQHIPAELSNRGARRFGRLSAKF